MAAAEEPGISGTMEATRIEGSKEVVFDVEGTELSVSDSNAVRGLGPCNVWEDGNKGYYRPETEIYDPVPSELLKPNVKGTMNAMVDAAEFLFDCS